MAVRLFHLNLKVADAGATSVATGDNASFKSVRIDVNSPALAARIGIPALNERKGMV
jgi:hypothetical protein